MEFRIVLIAAIIISFLGIISIPLFGIVLIKEGEVIKGTLIIISFLVVVVLFVLFLLAMSGFIDYEAFKEFLLS